VEAAAIESAAQDPDAVVAALLATPAAHFVTGPGSELAHLRLHDANRAFTELTGWPRERLTGRPLADLLAPAAGASRSPHGDAVARGGTAHAVLALRAPDGDPLPLDVSVIPLRRPDGSIGFWSFTVRDPESLPEPEVRLALAEQRLALVETLVSEGLWDWDPTSGELTWSDRLANMVGLRESPGDEGLREFFARVHPDDQFPLQATLREALTGDTAFELECRLRHEHGHYIHTQCRGLGHRDRDGRLLRVLGAVRDVTDARETRAALAHSEDTFAAFADALPGALFRHTLRADHSVAARAMNEGFRDIWELDGEADGNDPELLLHMVHPEDQLPLQRSVVESAEHLTDWVHRWRIRTPDGRRKWLQGHGRPRRQPNGDTDWYSVIMDVTAQVEAELALADSREQLHRIQKLDALGKLTGGVAHDFNNLLTVVLSSLELLRDDPDAEDRLQLIDDAISAAKRGGELTHDLLAFAKRATLAPRPVDLAEGAAQVVKLAERTLPEHVALRTDFDPGTPAVRVDAAALENALLNLVLNARDALPDGGEIVISTRPVAVGPGGASRGGRVSVRDTGTGIAGELQPFVFEPFFTTKPPGEGSGLGLSMVHGFVHQSGGELSLDSGPGRGTTVTLTFPEAGPDDPLAEAAEDWRPSPGVRARILLVEDEDVLRRVMTQCLTSDSCAVTSAADGDEALGLWKSAGPFDLLVTDARMPGSVQGPELVQRLRAMQPELPCLVVTGYADETTEVFEHGDPGLQLLRKPVGRVELLRAVTRLLARDG
jgi:signal transduction histidine kinase